MSNYSYTGGFAAKDSLPSGNTGKVVRGSEFETEFNNISTAITTKADLASPAFSGTINITSASINDGSVTISGFLDEDDMSTNSASHVPTQQSVKAYVDTSVSGIVTDSGTQTLTNKTLTSPVINTGVSGTAVLDEDNMSSNSATKLATQQSIKAYVDSQTASATLTGLTDTATSSQLAISDASTIVSNVLTPQNTIFFDQTAVSSGNAKIHWEEFAGGVLNTRYSIEYADTHLYFKYDGTEIARFKNGANFIVNNDLTVSGAFTSTGIDDNATGERLTITNNGIAIGNTGTDPTAIHGSIAVHATASLGSEFIAGTNDTIISSGAFMGGYVFRNMDATGSPPHYAGMWAESADTSGNMNLSFAAGSTKYESGTADLTIDHNGNTTVNGFTSTGIDDNATGERLTITNDGIAIGNTGTDPTAIHGSIAVHATASLGSEFIAGTNDTIISSGAFIGGYVFRNTDATGSPPHYAGMWAESADTSGNMDLHLAAGSTAYESTTAALTIEANGTVKAVGQVNMAGLPTSSAGLSTGDLWNDSGTLKIA
jgi:hypothetical protein